MAINLNAGVFSSVIGLLKLLTVVIGIVDLGLTANKYIAVSGEEFFLAMVIICFVLSLVFIILLLLGIINENDVFTKVDFAFHVVFGALLVIGALVWFISVGKYRKSNWGNVQRIFAGLFGLLNGLIYIAIGGLIFRAGSSSG